jgi:putative transposase
MPAPHPPEFRRRAIELGRERAKPIAMIAKDLGISEGCLRNWLAQADIDEGRREGLTTDEHAELVKLRRDKRVLEMEVEILKRRGGVLREGEHPPKVIYTFIGERCSDMPVAWCCRQMKVSTSGFYEWKARPASAREQANLALIETSREIHVASRGTYGAPRVHAELRLGLHTVVNRKRVERLMRQAGIQGVFRRRNRGCTKRDQSATPSDDLVNRQFSVDGPDRLWVMDATEHPTGEGKVYLAAALNARPRKTLGWKTPAEAFDEHLRSLNNGSVATTH